MERRTFSQKASDWITAASGGWPFVILFTAGCGLWVLLNTTRILVWDVYPFLFLNWIMTVISTLQSPLIMMSNNRQNDMDRERVEVILGKLDEVLARIEK